MDEEEKPKQPELPKELEEALANALHNIAFFLHEQVGSSHVILDVKHMSDAINRTGSTLITAAGLGLRIAKGQGAEQPSAEEADPAKLAGEAIERAIKQAKEKGSK
jgi:hypothetical protein